MQSFPSNLKRAREGGTERERKTHTLGDIRVSFLAASAAVPVRHDEVGETVLC